MAQDHSFSLITHNIEFQPNMTERVLFVVVLALILAFTAALPLASMADDKPNSSSSSKDSSTEQSATPSAVVWYRELANKGDMEAQYNLGTVYETGFGVAVNYKQAAKWFMKAADKGQVLAQLKLGILYYLGKGVPESSIKGDKWIRSAAKNGNELARQLQNKVLAPDIAVDMDVKSVVEQVHKALANGDIYANEKLIQILAKLAQEHRHPPKKKRFAGEVTGSGAKPGTVKTEVPQFLEKEKPQVEKPKNDLASIQRAAKEGDAESQYRLGRMYETGQKVDHDQVQAVKWYASAAQRGQHDAQYRLGLAYLYGTGINKDPIKGKGWIKKAAAHDVEAARQLLVFFKPRTSDVEDDNISILASVYLERALNGDHQAQEALAFMLQNGWGVKANHAAAKKWFSKARMGSHRHDTGSADNRSITDILGVPEENSEVSDSVQVSETAQREESSSHSSIRVNSLFIPIGFILLGLVLSMVVFRWMERQRVSQLPSEEGKSVF